MATSPVGAITIKHDSCVLQCPARIASAILNGICSELRFTPPGYRVRCVHSLTPMDEEEKKESKKERKRHTQAHTHT